MKTNNRWKQFKTEKVSNNSNNKFKKKIQTNTRWKKDENLGNENNKFKSSRYNDTERSERFSRFNNDRGRGDGHRKFNDSGDNRFKRSNRRFRNNRSFDKRPTRITRDKNGEILLPGSTIRNTSLIDAIKVKPIQEKKKKKKEKVKDNCIKKKEEKEEKEDNSWQKDMLQQMQYETDSEQEDENGEIIYDDYDEFSIDNFTQQHL